MSQEGIYRRIYDMQARIEGELEREIHQGSEGWDASDALVEMETANARP